MEQSKTALEAHQSSNKTVADAIKETGVEIKQVQAEIQKVATELKASNDSQAQKSGKEVEPAAKDPEAAKKVELQNLDMALVLASPDKQLAMIKLIGKGNLRMTAMQHAKTTAEVEAKAAEKKPDVASDPKEAAQDIQPDTKAKEKDSAAPGKGVEGKEVKADDDHAKEAQQDKAGPTDRVESPKSQKALPNRAPQRQQGGARR